MISVCIKSTKKDVPFDFWKNPKISHFDKTLTNNALIHFDNLDNSLINKIYQNDCVNTSNGFFINFRGDKYVITCRHSIINCYKSEILVNNKYYEISKVIDIPEFDTSVFKVNDTSINLDKYVCIDILNTKTHISKSIDEATIISYNKTIKTKFIKMIENDVGNEYFTVIPQLCLELKNKSSMFGLSGSPCFDNKNNFIGHVFSYDDDNNSINLIPVYCLKYIFQKLLPKSIFKLKTINLEGSLCSIFDDITQSNLYAYKIKQTSPIEYKIYDTDKNFSFRENMLITKIDDNILTKDGKIFLKYINDYVTPQTYGLFRNHSNYIIIDGYELIDGNYKEFSLKIIPELLLEYMVFSEIGHNKIVIYKNLVFTELNREILNFIPVIDKKSKIKEILDNPYDKKYNKKIILIDILENSSEDSDKLKKMKLTLNKNSFLFLNKINKKCISTLEELSVELLNINESNFAFDINNNKKYQKLIY